MDQLAAERTLVHLFSTKTQICSCSDALLYFCFQSAVSIILFMLQGLDLLPEHVLTVLGSNRCAACCDCRDLMGTASRLR